MSSISIEYFASLREIVGADKEVLSGEFTTHTSLYEALAHKYGFSLPASMIQVAVNDEFASMDDKVLTGSKIVFIPPMAGG